VIKKNFAISFGVRVTKDYSEGPYAEDIQKANLRQDTDVVKSIDFIDQSAHQTFVDNVFGALEK
jgi:hypothetical protein